MARVSPDPVCVAASPLARQRRCLGVQEHWYRPACPRHCPSSVLTREDLLPWLCRPACGEGGGMGEGAVQRLCVAEERRGTEGTRIDLDGVCRWFGTGDTTVKAIDQVSLHVEESAFLVVLCPSGPGKTVLVVTHNREISRISDRVIELSSGHIAGDGPPAGGRADIEDLRW